MAVRGAGYVQRVANQAPVFASSGRPDQVQARFVRLMPISIPQRAVGWMKMLPPPSSRPAV